MQTKVAFYKGRHRLFDRLVQWWTRGPYSHCELLLYGLPDGTAAQFLGANGFRVRGM